MSNKDKTSTKTDLLHLVYSVTNFRNKVRVLDGSTVSYSSWATLFQLHARAYRVLHHIDGTNGPTRDDPSYDFWARIDSIVFQWIYGMLSDELLVRVLESDSTAFQAWSRIKSIFLNNKGSRAADLEHEFTNLTLSYCKKLKEIDDQRLVLQLLKDLAESLPPGSYDLDRIKIPNGLDFNSIVQNPDTNADNHSKPNLRISPTDTALTAASTLGPTETFTETKESIHVSNENHSYSDARSLNGSAGVDMGNKYSSDNAASQGENNGAQTRNPASNSGNNTYNAPDQVEAEWIEQYEPGVYITLVALRDGTRDLKRVRFSRRRFGEHQAETWWSENRESVYERYNVRGSDKASVSAQSARQSAETLPTPAQY